MSKTKWTNFLSRIGICAVHLSNKLGMGTNNKQGEFKASWNDSFL